MWRRTRNGQKAGGETVRCRNCVLVRERDFSLDFWAIRPSEFVGTRRKVALRIKAYVWAPVLRSFDKLREVGVLSYLSFTLCLSVL